MPEQSAPDPARSPPQSDPDEPLEQPTVAGQPKRGWHTWARYLVGVGIGALALWAVAGQRGELTGATADLSRMQIDWLALAIASEFGSVVAFARMQGRLLRSAGGDMPDARLLGMTFAAGAIASSIPAGPAVSSVYAYRQYRRFGSGEATAGWTLVATLITSALGLTSFATVGVLVAERQSVAFDLLGVTLGVLLVAVLAAALLWQRRIVFGAVLLFVRIAARLARRRETDSAALVERWRSHLSQVRLTWRDFLPAFAWSVMSWVFDWGALLCGYLAVGASIPWSGVVLAYGAGQLASNLPITPGGLGLVEGSLTIALVAYGGAQVSTVAAVLLYRIVSFWGYLPVSWGVWAAMAVRDKRADRRAEREAVPVMVTVPAFNAVASESSETGRG